MGENARTVGEQADAKAIEAMQKLQRNFATAIDTIYYPGKQENQPTHEIALISFRTVEESHKRGGRLPGHPTEQPIIRAYTRNQSVLDKIFNGIGTFLEAEEEGTEVQCGIDFETIQMDGYNNMRHAISVHHSNVYNGRLKGRKINEANSTIQGRMEASGSVTQSLSPST
mmetsp:Transcript_42209/g.72084  ORF Transcript_42209/g.72084 Transcript_42209/m.72084 type:complete len:170 (-) Transcript_42209:8-517(-)